MQSRWRDGKSPTRTPRKAPSPMPARAAPPRGEPGRFKVETGRTQVQHSSLAAPAAASHPPPGTGSQPCQHLEGRGLSLPLCARTPPLLSALPGSVRHGPPAPAPIPRWATGAVLRRAGPGQVAAAGGGGCGSSPLPRAPAGARVPEGCRGSCGCGLGEKERVQSFSLLFPRAPLFITAFPDHPTDTVPPSSSPRCGSWTLSLPLPPAPPPLPCTALAPRCSPLSRPPALPKPLGGVRVSACGSPTPSPAVSSGQVSLCFAMWGRRGGCQPAVAFLQLLPCLSSGVSVCARGNLCKHGFLQKGEGVGERSASSVLSPSRRSPLIP